MDSDLKYLYENYAEPFDDSSDEEEYVDETTMIQAILADAERAEEHVLDFKGVIKGHRSLNQNSARGHLMLMGDYFAPDALFIDNFRQRF